MDDKQANKKEHSAYENVSELRTEIDSYRSFSPKNKVPCIIHDSINISETTTTYYNSGEEFPTRNERIECKMKELSPERQQRHVLVRFFMSMQIFFFSGKLDLGKVCESTLYVCLIN